MVDNSIIVQDKINGLQKLEDLTLESLYEVKFPSGLDIWEIISLGENEWLFFTQQEGIYQWNDEGFTPWKSELDTYLKQNNFYSLAQDDENLYIGTIQKGLIIADKEGKIKIVIDRNRGLQNNTILSLTLDREKNLWLGLDNGIDFIELNSNVQYIGRNGSYGSGYCSAIWKESIYFGTNQGVFKTSFNKQENITLISSLKGQTWNFWPEKDQLLCAHHKGIYSIRDNIAKEIKLLPGCWIFVPLPWNENILLAGTYNGIAILERAGASFHFVKMIDDFQESARVMFFDQKNNLWISHGYKGLYKIRFNEADLTTQSVDFYGMNKGLPSLNNDIFFIRDEMIISTINGIYRYEESYDTLVPYPKWNHFLGSLERVSKVIEANKQNIYVFQNGIMGRLEILNDSLFMYNRLIVPSLDNQYILAFEDILFIDDNNLMVGIEDGFAMINPNKEIAHEPDLPFLFTQLECFATQKYQDHALPLTFNTYTDPIVINNKLAYKYNNLRIGFSVPLYNSAKNIRFNFSLNDSEWEGQPNQTEVILSNLHEGRYTLDIHLLDTKTGQNATRTIQFIINPPWFRQWYFYSLVGLLIISIAAFSYMIIKRKIDREKRRELIAQKRKMIQREISLKQKSTIAEQELIKIKNEKLQAEVIHKSKELANSTMSIIHKNQILTDLKTEMMLLYENHPNLSSGEIRAFIKKIDAELDDKQSWNVFETHFDRVHENFFQKFREMHSELTPKDLRMCAFLRMNLSSKEIAPLQNISIRSVEISRYRLRKKLKISHEQNLTDYIMGI